MSMEDLKLRTRWSAFLSLVIVLLLSTICSAGNHSHCWEGSYEADVLPTADGWTVAGNAAAFTTQNAGSIQLDTIGTGDLGWYQRSDVAFDFSTGATYEIRMRSLDALNQRDGTVFSIDDGGSSEIAYFGSREGDLAVGVVGGGFAYLGGVTPNGSWTTIRAELLLGTDNFRVYLNDNATPIYTGTLGGGWEAGNSLSFGDQSGGADGNWEIDHIRWTTQGAFAVPEPATISLLSIGLLTILRKKRN